MIQMIPSVFEPSAKETKPRFTADIEALRLRDAWEAYSVRHTFKPGDLIHQKPLVTIRKSINSNGFAIVIEILPEPIRDEHTYEMLDITIGYLDQDEDFVVMPVCSIRFEPVTDDVIKEIMERKNED